MTNNPKRLSKDAYGGIKGEDYVPFISADEKAPEATGYSITMGIIFAIVFAAANTYLGLRVGLTISAGIPGAILATGLLKTMFKRNSILEANYVASLAAVGESIAGGIIFVLPAIILIGINLSITQVALVTIIGGFMGVYFVTPVRRYLIVQEHGELIYPESMAQAEVLVNANQGGKGFQSVLNGLGVGFVYKLLSGGLGLWNETASYIIASYQGTMIGIDTLSSLLGVGFIVGTSTSALMFAGSVLAWLSLIPLIKFFGVFASEAIFPSTVLIAEMSASEIWSSYIRYIGAGTVAAGGFISLAKSLPTIIKSFREAMSGFGKGEKSQKRIDEDPSFIWVLAAAILGCLLTWFVPVIGVGPIGAILAVFFSFFFSVVSARMVGVIGASNNPVSGMTIATLLVIASIYRAMGATGTSGMQIVLMAAGVVCVAIAVAGGVAQSLKATYIVGGSPRKIQHGMFISLAIASVAAGATVLLLHNAYTIGGEQVAAPQATLMRLIVEGIMTGRLPWTLVIIGAVIAVFCALAKLPILPVALGIYLPISLNAAIFFGGIIRKLVEMKFKKDESNLETSLERGTLIASGLVAGDALTGILIGIFAALNIRIDFLAGIITNEAVRNLVTLGIFVILAGWLYRYSINIKGSRDNA
ncbi:OPT family oligopeptide transporter [Paratissierella segnis]|jgi:putative OPT family oligopeptide transporter|uniref:Oligopeptide transporter, OPT family n=1 Tax=Paratissierella segnis TaxID=2763679 RepID=A0A926IKF2_9FIRM|nr:oligopeptide transporter, OPT family [Paratissierella segnis]MBC8587638.1 oligopeptide transporter, OPT family [Paratissierella segnis]